MISCYAAFFMDKKYKKTAATCYAQERRSFREMCLKFWGCIDLEYIHTCTHTHKKNIRTHAHTHTHSNTNTNKTLLISGLQKTSTQMNGICLFFSLANRTHFLWGLHPMFHTHTHTHTCTQSWFPPSVKLTLINNTRTHG